MSLLENWRELAYNSDVDQNTYNQFWNAYFLQEKDFYDVILHAEEPITGTIPSLAEKFNVEEMIMVGILDGINDSLVEPNPIETMDNTTELSLNYDKEKLYKNMVLAKAEWLYTLPVWDELLDEERRNVLYKEAKTANTVVKGKKVGRNDPCPCGSGKKYKKCCGR